MLDENVFFGKLDRNAYLWIGGYGWLAHRACCRVLPGGLPLSLVWSQSGWIWVTHGSHRASFSYWTCQPPYQLWVSCLLIGASVCVGCFQGCDYGFDLSVGVQGLPCCDWSSPARPLYEPHRQHLSWFQLLTKDIQTQGISQMLTLLKV